MAPSVHKVSITRTYGFGFCPTGACSWAGIHIQNVQCTCIQCNTEFDTCTWPVGASKKEEKKATGQKTPVKLVRRNLFTESEEGDENNSTARVPRKRKLSESGGKKDEAKRRFHRRNTVGMYIQISYYDCYAWYNLRTLNLVFSILFPVQFYYHFLTSHLNDTDDVEK